MEFIRYSSKKEFLKNNLRILLKDEAKNEIMIGILMEHHERKIKKWFLGRIEDNGRVEAIFLVDDDKEGLLLYAPHGKLTDEVAEFLVNTLVKNDVELEEVLATKEISRKIAKLYVKKTKRKMLESEYKYIFKFTEFKEKYLLKTDEKVEKIEEEIEMKTLKDLIREMYLYTYNGKECPDEEARKIARVFIKKGLYVLRNEEKEIVCQAVTVRKQVNGCAIGGVVTLKKYRGQGYAKRCVYALCEQLLENGCKFIVLHVSPQNESAISAYQKIGFEKIDETEKIKFL